MDLSSKINLLPSVGPVYEKRLQKLEIETIEDLLLHVPHRYLDFRQSTKINRVQIGDSVTVKASVISIKNQYTKRGTKLQIARVGDDSGEIAIVWFNQPFLIQSIFSGDVLSLSGKVEWFGREKALISPEYEKVFEGKKTVHTGRLVPIYSETSGLSSKWLRAKVNLAYNQSKNNIKEFLPVKIREDFNLLELVKAIEQVHFPKSPEEADRGRERLAFDELLMFQCRNIARRISWQRNIPANKLSFSHKDVDKFTDSLPFTLTKSQKKVIDEILCDLSRPFPMNRLLQGDVGSGKTVVAATAAFVSFINGCQTVIMAPTQILAQQHFNTLNSLLQSFKVPISLITSDTRLQTPERSNGGQVFVGTHALIHQNINFDKVALVVIDEQQKFGVEQREHLIKKVKNKKMAPHILTMTATPIPRTVALTFYGDLDLSTLNEIPAGRQKINTWVVPSAKRQKAYEWIRSQITDHRSQIFVVCPLIEESSIETMQSVRAVKKQYEEIKKSFHSFNVGLLHGKQKSKEKSQVLENFKKGTLDVLVATPIVEVGIDIPNATIMLVEAADRFGLAQLHQLRGRVGRGGKKSYCLLFSEAKGQKVLARLSAMEKSFSGFELAELDLKLRGPGEIFGLKQHGLPELKIASWQDVDLIKRAKDTAQKLLTVAPGRLLKLKSYI